jgi:hypothetical protein
MAHTIEIGGFEAATFPTTANELLTNLGRSVVVVVPTMLGVALGSFGGPIGVVAGATFGSYAGLRAFRNAT